MLDFFISIVVFAISTFILALSVRYGMIGAERLDSWFSFKSGKNVSGFDWYYRIPFKVGMIPEYFYGMVLKKENYFKTNWWALRTSSFISILLFIALLQNRTGVMNYYSLGIIKEAGFSALFTSGTFIWYLNFITLMYVGLATLLVIESIKVAGFYAPLRIIYYGFLCFTMASLTIAVLTVIIFLVIIYLIFKVIKFLFFSNKNKHKSREDDEETAGDILKGGFSQFRSDLLEWESNRRTERRRNIEKHKSTTRKKPVITRRKRSVKSKPKGMAPSDDIPRLHPD